MLSNNLELVGCRIPKNPIALELLASVNFPIAAPSANLATKISSTQTNHLSSELKENAFLIDGGKTTLGLESTVVKLNNNKLIILRLGSITEEEIKGVIEQGLQDKAIEKQESELVHGALNFDDIVIRSVMTPRTKMFTLNSKTMFQNLGFWNFRISKCWKCLN